MNAIETKHRGWKSGEDLYSQDPCKGNQSGLWGKEYFKIFF